MIPTDELRELLAKVTPGEWHVVPTEYGWRVGYPRPGNEARIDSLTSESLPEAESNCRIMAIAPFLAAEVLRLRDAISGYFAAREALEAAPTCNNRVFDAAHAAFTEAREKLRATLTQADERESE